MRPLITPAAAVADPPRVDPALQRSAMWLTVAVCSGVQFLPPLAVDTLASASRAAFAAAVLVLALLMHWTQLARAAWRRQLSALPWLALAVLLVPLGGAAALLLLALGRSTAHTGSGAVQPG